MFFLPLHPSVLEPDFDLPFGETQSVCDLDTPPAGQVAVEVELLLQLEDLVAGVRRPGTLVVTVVRAVGGWNGKTTMLQIKYTMLYPA